MTTYRIKDIAEALSASAFGNVEMKIASLAEPASAGPNDLAMATTAAYAEQLAAGQARAALVWPGADWRALGLEAAIVAPRPRYAMSGLTAMMDKGQGFEDGIHPSAVIHPEAILEPGVSIGPLCVISARARIGAGSVLGPQCHVGKDAVLGDFAFLREQVSIGARVQIGARFIAQPGARIGGDGFSFVTPEASGVEQTRKSLGSSRTEAAPQVWARIHSLGAVRIGDDVEVGANTCIDNGTIRDTIIGDGTKIDNLVQIGHNCVIGRNCLLCGHSGMAGSARLGDNVVLGGQSGVSDNVTLGDNVIAGGASAILTNVPAGRAVLGYPATRMDLQIELSKAIRRLPRLLRDVSALKSAVFKSGDSD